MQHRILDKPQSIQQDVRPAIHRFINPLQYKCNNPTHNPPSNSPHTPFPPPLPPPNFPPPPHPSNPHPRRIRTWRRRIRTPRKRIMRPRRLLLLRSRIRRIIIPRRRTTLEPHLTQHRRWNPDLNVSLELGGRGPEMFR